jgi:O-antigen/teichoic acid export membrane protein
MSSLSGKVEHVDLLVTDADVSAPTELSDAQQPVVLHYEAPAGAPAQSLKQRAVRSSAWTMVAFGFAQVIKVATNPILAALLVPEHFGTVALVSVFVTGLLALSDVGIEQAIIQNKRGDDPVFLNTAWTLHAVRGVFLWLGCCVIAYPVYWFFHGKTNAHDLLIMLPVAGLGPLLNGFNSTKAFTLSRHLHQGRQTVLTVIYQMIGVAVPILIAMRWPSAWAFVLGGLASNAFWLFATHALLPGARNRFCWDATVRREIMKFGRWIMVSTLITYTAMQIDRVLMGKLLDEAWLGLYAVALNLVRMPSEIISRLAHVSLFPALARAAEARTSELRSVLWRARGLILSVSLALTLGVVLGAPLFIQIFYSERWHYAGLLARWASIGAWITLLTCTADRALLALGKTRILATSNTVNLIVTVVGGLVGRYVDMKLNPATNPLEPNVGIVGFIIGMSAGKLAGHLMIQIEMARCGIPIFRQDTLYSAVLLAMCLAGIALPHLAPGFDASMVLYNGIAAVVVCGVTCSWAGLKVLRGIR